MSMASPEGAGINVEFVVLSVIGTYKHAGPTTTAVDSGGTSSRDLARCTALGMTLGDSGFDPNALTTGERRSAVD